MSFDLRGFNAIREAHDSSERWLMRNRAERLPIPPKLREAALAYAQAMREAEAAADLVTRAVTQT